MPLLATRLRPYSLCSLPIWLQRHQEYLKMLAEREEALGESPSWPGFLCPLVGGEGVGEGVRALQRVTP